MYDSNYYIIYPAGDMSKICVAECSEKYKSDLILASRYSFDTEDLAVIYAKKLAKENGKTFIDTDGNSYLD